MGIPGRRTFLPENEILNLESQLGKLLSIRQANPEFVQHLRYRLTTEPSVQLEKRNRLKAFLILAVALFSGGLIIFIASLLYGKSGRHLV